MPVDRPDRTVHLAALGCAKNRVDSEHLLGLLADRGWEYCEDPGEARVLLVNTCGFIQSAVEEGLDVILEMAAYKKSRPDALLAVAGCLPQRYGAELAENMPEVDLWWGSGGLDRLPDALENPVPPPWDSPGFDTPAGSPRLRAAPFWRAYLKIAEGCSNACSYCLIPSLRGPYRSRPPEDILAEAEGLAASGVVEIIVVAQDTTRYGRDLSPQTSTAELLTRLARLAGPRWLRLMYAYPSGITDELLEVMAGEEKVAPYLDLPLQHASPDVLRRMGRGGRRNLTALVDRLRRAVPGISLRTTLMTGFPGETEEDFRILLDFVRRARFDHLGVFKFSPEKGAPAAGFPDQTAQRTKENRRRKLMAAQRRISREINKELVGRTLPVLVEGRHPETDLLLIGRTPGMAPEVDGSVIITGGNASAGEIRPVLITEAYDYDLVGQTAD